MKAAVLREYGKLNVEEIPEVTMGDYDAIVEIAGCGFCNGTDMKLIQGLFPPHGAPPTVMGHEAVGRVIKLGANVRNYHLGDTVYRPIARFDAPGDTAGLNFSWGGFAERGKVTDGLAYIKDHPGSEQEYWWLQQRACPGDIPTEDAIMLITLMETWSWLEAFGVNERTSVMIWGLGPVGLSMAECCRVMGVPTLIGVDINPANLERAREFGAIHAMAPDEHFAARVMELTGGKGVDRIVDAVGSRRIIAQSEELVSVGGRIGVYGIEPMKPGAEPKPYAVSGGKPFSLHFISPVETAAQETVLRLYREGRIQPRPYISHHLPLNKVGQTIDLITSGKALKIVVDIQ